LTAVGDAREIDDRSSGDRRGRLADREPVLPPTRSLADDMGVF
jgi:hypothetical protein